MTTHEQAVRERLAAIPHDAGCSINDDVGIVCGICTCTRENRVAAAVVRYGDARAENYYGTDKGRAVALAALTEEGK